MAVHQVSNQAASGLRQIIGILLNNLVEGDALEDDNLLAVGRELEAFHLAVGLRQLLTIGAIGIHRPYLATCEEGDAPV